MTDTPSTWTKLKSNRETAKKQSSSGCAKNTSISVRIEYPENVCPPRTSQRRRSSRDNPDAVKANCSNCGKAVYFPNLERYEKLLEVACCRECEMELDWFNPVPKEEAKAVERQPKKIKKPKKEKAERPPCPDCGGLPGKARGWRHEEGCPKITKDKKEKIERPSCPDCGGLPGKARGWHHETNCPRMAKKMGKKDEETLKQIGMIDPEAAERWKEMYSK